MFENIVINVFHVIAGVKFVIAIVYRVKGKRELADRQLIIALLFAIWATVIV